MIQNVGDVDRLVRVVVGVIAELAGYSISLRMWTIVLYLAGGVLIITGLSGWSLVYKLMGISTKK